MLGIDPVALAESCPKSTMLARSLRMILTGRPYFFNGQKTRLRVFQAINKCVCFDHYVETGTFLGMTTHFLARTAQRHGADVYSCEINERFFSIASRTVGDLGNVHLRRGDSVEFLQSLSPGLSDATNFVYLDAHWYDYLPLRDELLILGQWRNTVVMIDDFKVPSDERFGWDKYDDEREICLQHIAGSFGDRPVYFPGYPAQDEGDVPPRGYCVIATSPTLQRVLDDIPLLRAYGNDPVPSV
jgi:hypothetical protein